MTAKTKGRASAGTSWELTTFLLKTSVKTWQDALREDKRQTPPPNEDIAGIGTLVIKEAPERVPWWVERLGKHSSLVQSLRQRSPGAVLFVRSKNRLFALTFGYGRSLLAPDRLVHDFGIRVVLNSVDASRLRSVDLRTLETEPLVSRKQFAQLHPLASFGVDAYRDLLRGVAGSPGKNKLLLSGSDALHVRVSLAGPQDLEKHCGDLLAAFRRTNYRKDFAWIDHVRLVRDPAVRKKLEKKLYRECASNGATGVDYVVPDVLDGHQLGRLRAGWDRNSETALDASVVRERLVARTAGKTTDDFVRAAKSDRVGEPSLETSSLVRSWPLFDCILWSVDCGVRRYILTSGDWYELDADFIASTEKEFDRLASAVCPLKLPAALKLSIPKRSYYEYEYNKQAAKKLGLVLLDRKNMMKGLGASGIEPCDLLDTRRGIFVHVKDGKSSSMLSHLFNQGLVSLEGFLSVRDAREAVRRLAKLPQSGTGPLREPIAPSALTVLFAVVAPRKTGPWRLPFFSMLAAKNAAERIERLGAAPRFVRIDDKR